MREAIGVESGSWRSEVRDGVQFHWVATTEHKTGKGKVEFLIPELTVKVLDLMNRYAKPLQEKMALEVAELEYNPTPQDLTNRMLRLAKAKARRQKSFFYAPACLVRVNRLDTTLMRYQWWIKGLIPTIGHGCRNGLAVGTAPMP